MGHAERSPPFFFTSILSVKTLALARNWLILNYEFNRFFFVGSQSAIKPGLFLPCREIRPFVLLQKEGNREDKNRTRDGNSSYTSSQFPVYSLLLVRWTCTAAALSLSFVSVQVSSLHSSVLLAHDWSSESTDSMKGLKSSSND